jgi:hypothetical protein
MRKKSAKWYSFVPQGRCEFIVGSQSVLAGRSRDRNDQCRYTQKSRSLYDPQTGLGAFSNYCEGHLVNAQMVEL